MRPPVQPPKQEAWRRHVYFLSGFDPKGASHYYAMYQAEAMKQGAVNGMTVQVGPRRRDTDGNSSWTTSAVSPEARACETTYEFTRWDDIVRSHWPRSTWQLLLDLLFAYMLMLSSGGIPTVWRLSRKTLVGLAYPLVVLGGGLALGMVLGVCAATALYSRGANWPVAMAAGLLLLVLALWCIRKFEDKLNTTWLVRIFSFAGKHALGQLPELDTRLDAMAARIKKKMGANDVDEILIVGFSVGSILAVSAVARALRVIEKNEPGLNQPTLSLLTLGHCIPMLGLFPQAEVFREELGALAQSEALNWMDFSSPTDWGSFALVDPIKACKVLPPGQPVRNPVMRSPRFHTLFTPNSYALLRRNKRRMHLQYLMAGELPARYDYFAITAGACTLFDRYHDT
jgi:membrane protein implicated in regulation of membrane protease activity